MGITRGTGAAHLARAVVDEMAYQTRDVVDTMTAASGQPIAELRADGDASAMDLLLQLQADQLGVPVARPVIQETTALGAAYLAGLTEGVWSSSDEVATAWQLDLRCEPAAGRAEVDAAHARWLRAVESSRTATGPGRGPRVRPAPEGRAGRGGIGTGGEGGGDTPGPVRPTISGSDGASCCGPGAARGTWCRRRGRAPPPAGAPGPGRACPAAEHQGEAGVCHWRPDDVAGRCGRGERFTPSAARLPGEERLQPAGVRGLGVGGQDAVAPLVDVDDGHPGGADDPAGVGDHGLEQLLDVVGADELGGRLQGVEPGVVERVRHRADLLDGHAVDLAHLVDQQVDQRAVGQLDHELVDRLAAVALEDVDAHDVAAHGADAAGHLAEGAGPVGQPHADHERFHADEPTEAV